MGSLLERKMKYCYIRIVYFEKLLRSNEFVEMFRDWLKNLSLPEHGIVTKYGSRSASVPVLLMGLAWFWMSIFSNYPLKKLSGNVYCRGPLDLWASKPVASRYMTGTFLNDWDIVWRSPLKVWKYHFFGMGAGWSSSKFSLYLQIFRHWDDVRTRRRMLNQ